MADSREAAVGDIAGKVPKVALAFWIIKICATTLGETGGDYLSMTLMLGYVASTAIFLVFFLATLVLQVGARRYHPLLYWAVILSTTTVGTTTADYLDRSAGLGYFRGALLLLGLLAATLAIWRVTTGTISVEKIQDRRAETFYWFAILFSNTLGTAFGDYLADEAGLGYEFSALIIFAVLGIIALARFQLGVSKVLAFWLAFVMTRPLGATLGDLLTKSHAKGGLDLGTLQASLVILVFLAVFVPVAHRRGWIAAAGAGEGH